MNLLPIREPTTPSEILLNNVLSAIEQRKDPTYRATSAYKLAPGVIAVDDSLGETDVYFDLSMWDFTYPKLWVPDGNIDSYRNADTKVGMLPGVGRFPQVAGPSMALEFARDHLTATVSADWYEQPKPFEH